MKLVLRKAPFSFTASILKPPLNRAIQQVIIKN
jgi:hypothetical protein